MPASTSKPKLLFLVPNGGYFYSHRLPKARAAQAEGFEVAVVTNAPHHKELIEQQGIRVIPCDITPGGMHLVKEMKSLLAVMRIYKQERPHIVHHVTFKAILYGAIAAWIAGVPAIINAIAGLGYIFNSNEPKAKLLRFFLTPLFRLLLCRGHSLVLLQNKDDRDLLLEEKMIKPHKSLIIPGSGVELDRFRLSPLPSMETSVICTYSGRMIGIKGLATLKAAFDILSDRAPYIKLRLCGAPDPNNPGSWSEENLAHWAEKPNVAWAGFCADMAAAWQEAHIALQASDGGEGIPKSLLEAAACGRPIVATDVPGCREIVEHNRNGFLVPPKNPEALADAILTLAGNEPLCRDMAAESPRIIEEKALSAEAVTQSARAMYRKLRTA